MEEKFFFENGLNANEAFAGNIVGNGKLIENAFKVRLTARDFWVKVDAENPDALTMARNFFSELSNLFLSHGRRIDQRDFEQLLRAFKNGEGESIKQIMAERIAVSPRKKEVLPRSKAQLHYVEAMKNHDVVFGIGPAGTGKTYLAMAMAVSEFLKGNFRRIILTRPAKEAGENLGFLPGNLEEKIMPYLRPLYDALYDMLDFEEASGLIERNVIEVAPLAFMRGRTLNDAFIILDEAQNTTVDQMLMFLTRLGFNSKCVVTGDPSQADLGRNESSGLLHAEKTLKKIEEIKFCRFTTKDVVRHALLEKIINAYNLGK